jgi:uncharacterized protein
MAPNPLHVFRLNARELLRHPGLEKHIEVSLPATDLGIDDARITGDIDVDLTAVSGTDDITVRGSIGHPWRAACRRCLTEVTGRTAVDVDEIYADSVGEDDDAFEIVGDQVDLAPAIREYVVLELPDDVLCREDCAGICPQCGTDRNAGACGCDTTVRDERWAILDQLRADEN